ncbi:MAG: FAD-dependent oxidoreductase [Chloroflexota bacterium]
MPSWPSLSGASGAPGHSEQLGYPYLPTGADNCETLIPQQLPETLPFYFPPSYDVVFEAAPSGYINPRAMVQAQLTIAEKQGVEIIREQVEEVSPIADKVIVTLANKQRLEAKKVLVATGAFTNCFGLVNRKLAVKAEGITTVLAELPREEVNRLQHTPPINYKVATGPLGHLTILPPLRYPDDRFYIKVVCFTDADPILPDFPSLNAWFSQPDNFPYLSDVQLFLQTLIPDLRVSSWQVKPCVGAYTPSGKPFIDCLVPNQIYLAVGGNGGSAHPSDALGYLAAELMQSGAWSADIDPTPFQIQFADEWGEWMQESSMEA